LAFFERKDMSHKLDILENVDRALGLGGYGYLFGLPLANPGKSYTAATGVPINGAKGYAPGALWFNVKNGGVYENQGTKASATWVKYVPGGVGAVAAGYKLARGQATTVTASDTVVTGLVTVVSAVASLEDAPVIGADRAQAAIGDQAGTPAAGSILIKTFKPTGTGDATPIPATTFTKKVNWIAIGT
jgi:hypothetical protein